MGIEYSKLKDLQKPTINSTIHNSLSKIRDFHGAFKSVCDTFAISIVEYDQIFGNSDAFSTWDSDKNGVIDALEMFTGLILFSDARAEDKLKAMFELFDFNEIQTISKSDLEFLLYCCITSAFKLFSYAEEIVQEKEIHELIQNSLSKTNRVTLTDLVHFCAFSEDVNKFLYFFKIKGLSLPKPSKKQDLYEPLRDTSGYPKKNLVVDEGVKVKLENASRTWMGAIFNTINDKIANDATGKFNLYWVLGIDSYNSKHNFVVVPGKEIIIYYVSSVVVLLYCKLLRQKHYLEHDYYVSSICLGKEIVCTGEAGCSPKIRIWKIDTLETLQVLHGVHQTGVTLLGFTNNEQHLITCSNFTVIIYEWKLKNILVANNHAFPISDLYLLPRITSSSCFILGCDQEITVYSIDNEKLSMVSVNIEVSMCKSNIVCVTGQGIYDMKNENSFILITGHADGSVLLWQNTEFQRIVVVYNSKICAMKVLVSWYIISTGLGLIYFWDSNLANCSKVVEISMFPFKLLSFEVNSIKYVSKKLYISTNAGDLIEARVHLDSLKITAKRVGGIIQVPVNQTRIEFLSMELPFLVCSGENGVLTSIDLRSYEIIDTWSVGFAIKSFRCENFNDIICLAACCEEGKLFIRENWDTIYTPEAGKHNLTDLEFLNRGKLLVVASEDKNLYIFKKSSNYEKIYLISINSGIPITLTPSKDKKYLLIVTDKRKILMMNSETYELNFTSDQVKSVEWNKFHSFFSAKIKDTQCRAPVVWNQKGDCIGIGGYSGVNVWIQGTKIHSEYGYALKGHISSVLDLSIKSNLIFSLGQDRMIMYWTYEKVTLTNEDFSRISLPDTLKIESEYANIIKPEEPIKISSQFIQSAFLTSIMENSEYFFNTEHSNKGSLISVDLSHIYGGRVNLRNSIFYVHLHNTDQPPICVRNIVYFASRYVILQNPVTQIQSFYKNHKNKVTSLATHPALDLIASSEEGFVHIWKMRERVLISKLLTQLSGIFLLRFANNKQGAEILAVVGWCKNLPNVEIFDWVHEILLANVVLYDTPQDLQFSPTEYFKLSICGENHFSIWKRRGRVLICKKEVKIAKILTVMQYLVFKNRKEVDLLIGTGGGELLVSVEGRLLVHVENAHDGAILCITTNDTEIMGLIFTGGEDGIVRIWTHALIPVNKFSIFSLSDPVLIKSKQSSISNIQVYTCFSKKPLDSTLPKGAKIDPLVLAIGTTSGALIEVSLTNILSNEQITLQFKVHFENHCNNTYPMTKTLFALHPEYPVLGSIGEDKILKLWQYENFACIYSKELDNLCKPCFITFSPAGVLAIGMDNGVVILLACKDSAWGSSSRIDLELNVVATIRENHSAIICIKFSQDAEYFAVSYNNIKGLTRFQESSGVKTGGGDVTNGFVVIFQAQDNGAYKKLCKVPFPFGNIKDIASYPPRNECATCFIEFSEDNMFISMIHQQVTSNFLPDSNDYRPLIFIWDLVSKNFVQNFEHISNIAWPSTIINALLFSSITPGGVNILSHSFIEDHSSLIITDTSGFINTFRLSTLASAYGQKMKHSAFKGLNIQKTCRRYLAHTGEIIQNKIIDQNLFTTAYNENCIVQWKIVAEDPNWELDSSEYLTTSTDPFSEVLNNEKFNKVFTETWMPQSETVIKAEKSIDLVLEAAIGRRARDRRNNLKYDSDDRVLYITGNNLVIHSREGAGQTFVQYNYHGAKNRLSEISAFCITDDKRNIFMGTCDLEAKIMLWDLFAYVMIFSLSVQDTCIIQSMQISPSCRYLICIGLSKLYKQILFLIEISSEFIPRIVSSTPINTTCVYKIKEINVTEKNGLEIFTCGVQHFTRWELNSDVLHNYNIGLPDDQAISLLCISFFNCIIVTAADDGKMYIWHENKLFRSVPSHDGCVLALTICEEMGILVTGGIDGHIIVWKIAVEWYGEMLQVQLDSLREYSLHDPHANILAYSVQSLSVGKFVVDEGFKVLIGTQNGDSYELSYEANADMDALVKVSAAVDSQSLQSMACDVSSFYLFTISAGGIFAIWEIRTFSQVYNFDFHKNAVKLAVFHLKTFDNEQFEGQVLYVAIGFEDEVILVKIKDGEEVEHEVLSEFTTPVDNLTDFKVSTDERFMALACNKDQRPQVDIYQVRSTEWIIDKNLFGFRAPVTRLDFSTDGYYLMCEDNLGEVLVFELETQNIASFHSIEFEIEWLNEGLRHSTGLKSIHQLYNINNKIACITKSPGLSILAIGDEYGVIALYQLPYVPGSNLIMMPGHSYRVSLIMFTHDDKYLITYSEMDRCILKWRIGSDIN